MKKRWCLFLGMLLVVALLASCKPQTVVVTKEVPQTVVVTKEVRVEVTPTPEPLDAISQIDPSGQEIIFWHVSTKKHEEVLLSMIDEFNQTNPWGITVKPEYGGYYGDIYKKIMAAIAAGEPPDLAVAYPNQAADYALAGAVEPLDAYIASAKYGLSEEELDDFFSAFLEGDRNPFYDNQMLTFPPNRSMEVMYYNVDWLQELGYDGPPETWEEFGEMCEKATQDVDGDGQNDTFGYAYSGGASNFATFVFSRGGDLVSEDGTRAVFNNQAAVEAMTFLRDLFEKGYAYQIAERYGDQTDVANCKALFAFGSTAGLRYWEDAFASGCGANWDIAPPPHSTEEPVVDLYGPSVVVFKTTPERQLASWLFIKWFTEPEQSARWAMDSSYFPVRKSAAALMTDFFAENPRYAKAWGFVKYGRVEPNVPGWQAVRGYIADAMTEILTTGADPQTVLDAAVEKANQELGGQ